MVHRCCISSCGMNVRVAEAKGLKGLTYHCFPVKEPNREKWIQVILPHVDKPEAFKIVQGYTRVCSKHFRRKDYSLDSRKRARLNSNAIPSVFHTRTTSAPVSSESLLENTKSLQIVEESNSSKPLQVEVCIQIENEGPSLIHDTTTNNQIISTIKGKESSPVDRPTTTTNGTLASKPKDTEEIIKTKNTHHKRRRTNRNSAPPSSKCHTKPLLNDELNIEGVGEALAEINLSTLMGVSRENNNKGKEKEKNAERISSLSNIASTGEVEKSTEKSGEFDGVEIFPLSPPLTKTLEQELLQSIQAVNIHCGETLPLSETSFLVARSESSSLTMIDNKQEDHNLSVSSQLDLPEEFLDEESVLSSLDNSSLTSFDSQDLLEAINDTDDFPSADEIDKLACDLNSSFLDNEGLKPLLLDLDEIRISELELPSFSSDHHWIDFGSDMISQLSHITFEPAAAVPSQLETPQQIAEFENNCEANTGSSPPATADLTVPQEINTPETPRPKKAAKYNSNCTGRFSAERFRDCDKDFEYYTGFSSYKSFESFYYSLDAHIEKLKVTDIMYGVSSLLQASSENQQDSTGDETGSSSGPTPYIEEPKRRLSQGKSMIRIDELFMTLTRLKRKLPEKVLGHMFCTSQSTVSRIVRAWTVLLSKVVDTMPSKRTSPKFRKSTSPTLSTLSTDESNCSTPEPVMPESVIRLFQSDLARSIVSSGNSRKTSSSTCTSTSRSKRPKKEKTTVGVSFERPTPLTDAIPVDRPVAPVSQLDSPPNSTVSIVSSTINIQLDGSD